MPSHRQRFLLSLPPPALTSGWTFLYSSGVNRSKCVPRLRWNIGRLDVHPEGWHVTLLAANAVHFCLFCERNRKQIIYIVASPGWWSHFLSLSLLHGPLGLISRGSAALPLHITPSLNMFKTLSFVYTNPAYTSQGFSPSRQGIPLSFQMSHFSITPQFVAKIHHKCKHINKERDCCREGFAYLLTQPKVVFCHVECAVIYWVQCLPSYLSVPLNFVMQMQNCKGLFQACGS